MNRRVLVTGGSRGLGAAIAVRLARDGFDVSVNYRSNEGAAEDALKAIQALGGQGRLLRFDVADRAACLEILETELAQRGPFWGVVCNAGIRADAPFPGLRPEDWDAVVNTNLGGFYNVLKPLVMPMIRTRQGGRIVVMSSAAGLMGNRGQVNYSASKAALIGAVKALAQELGKRGITVNSVAPGLMETEMIEGARIDDLLRHVPMRRLGRPEEAAAAVSFLMSGDAAYVTGQTLSVNGGLC